MTPAVIVGGAALSSEKRWRSSEKQWRSLEKGQWSFLEEMVGVELEYHRQNAFTKEKGNDGKINKNGLE